MAGEQHRLRAPAQVDPGVPGGGERVSAGGRAGSMLTIEWGGGVRAPAAADPWWRLTSECRGAPPPSVNPLPPCTPSLCAPPPSVHPLPLCTPPLRVPPPSSHSLTPVPLSPALLNSTAHPCLPACPSLPTCHHTHSLAPPTHPCLLLPLTCHLTRSLAPPLPPLPCLLRPLTCHHTRPLPPPFPTGSRLPLRWSWNASTKTMRG